MTQGEHNFAIAQMAPKLDPSNVIEMLKKLAPQFAQNIRSCNIGLRKEFVPPKYAGNIVLISFDNLIIPSGVRMHQMIDMISSWCNIPKYGVIRCNVVFAGICQIWSFKAYEVQIQQRMPFFPCHKDQKSVELISQKVFQELLKVHHIMSVQSSFLWDRAIWYVLRQHKYCKRQLDQIVVDKEIKFILGKLSQVSLQAASDSSHSYYKFNHHTFKQWMDFGKLELLKKCSQILKSRSLPDIPEYETQIKSNKEINQLNDLLTRVSIDGQVDADDISHNNDYVLVSNDIMDTNDDFYFDPQESQNLQQNPAAQSPTQIQFISINLITNVGSAIVKVDNNTNLFDFVVQNCQTLKMKYPDAIFYLNYSKISIQQCKEVQLNDHDIVSLFAVGQTPDTYVRGQFFDKTSFKAVFP